MATVNIKFFRPDVLGSVTAVYGIDVSDPETFTSSATSQATTFATRDNETYVRIVSVGGDVWVTFGASPTAVTQEGTLILEGLPEVFRLEKGYKVAVIN